MLFKHQFLNLNIGLVKENFAVVKKSEKALWEARGFKKIHKYPIYGYKPNSSEIIMLGVPTSIEEFGYKALKNSHIIDVCTCYGTYGMGGPGFFGLKLQGEYGVRWLTYCIWVASQHILFDDTVLECHPKYEKTYSPFISSENYSNDLQRFKELLFEMVIKEIVVLEESIEIILIDNHGLLHSVKSYKYSNKFPEQGGTGMKRNSFETGEMKDYWLITYDETDLMV